MESMQVRGRKPQIYMFYILVRKVSIVTGTDQNRDPTARKLEEEEPNQQQDEENQPPTTENLQKDGERDEDETEDGESEEAEDEMTEEEDGEVEKDGKKKGGGKKKGKKEGKKKGKKEGKKKGEKGGKKKGKKKKPPLPPPLPLPPPPPPPYYRLLPPFSLGFRVFDEESRYVEQVVLPTGTLLEEQYKSESAEIMIQPEPLQMTRSTDTSQQLPEIGSRRTKTTIQEEPTNLEEKTKKKGSKKDKKKKKGKNKKSKKDKKKKKVKKLEAPIIVPPPPQPPCPYSTEELYWKLPDEEWFGRGLLVLTSKSADEVISWVQKGYMGIEVCRWKGYGEREKIASAKVCLPSRMAETVLRATNKDEILPLVVNCEGEAKIRDNESFEIGTLSVVLTLTCYGDGWNSPVLLSSCGLEAMLSSCPAARSQAEDKRRKELDDMYDVSNLIEFLRSQETNGKKLNLPITFEDIMCALC